MSWQIAIWVAGALLLCWTLGAYNRLVGLRSAIVKGFEPVDRQFGSRHALSAKGTPWGRAMPVTLAALAREGGGLRCVLTNAQTPRTGHHG